MNHDFLLKSQTARQLYHDHAAKMPIIDYHCHINPMEIHEDKCYNSITEVWLGGDDPESDRKPAVSLDTSGTSAIFRDHRAVKRQKCDGSLREM